MLAIDQALQIDPAHRDGWQLKGDVLRATGQPTKAVEAYRTAIKNDPGNTHARLALATIALEQNRLDDARAEVSAALKVAPNNLFARYTQAQIDFRDKKLDAARDQLAAVLKTAPDFRPALLLSGAVEYSLGNLQTAEANLNKVVKTAPGNVYAGACWRPRNSGLVARTTPRARSRRLESRAGRCRVRIVAGRNRTGEKAYAEASEHFEAAAKISPDSAAIRTELGLARLAQGDSRAMADLQAAAAMEGSGEPRRHPHHPQPAE